MKKGKVTICIGTVGSPTFQKCVDTIYDNFDNHPSVDKIVIIKNKSPQSAWLNEMRKACSDTEWCLQVDEDMYLYKNAIDELINLYRRKEKDGISILNASSLLYDLFLERNIGSLKLWNSKALQRLEFKDVLGGDRDFAKRASNLGFNNVETKKVLGDHDSAPTPAIAFSKYFEYTQKIRKFNDINRARNFSNMLRKKWKSDNSYISKKAYDGSCKALKNPLVNKSKRATFIKEKKFNKSNNFINNYFDNVYVLNLDSRPDKMRSIKKRLNKFDIEYERWPASGPGDKEVAENFLKTKKNKDALIKTIGAMGCLISHRKIIKDAMIKGYSRILIFEDDAMFDPEIKTKVKKIDSLQKNWGLVYLGGSQHNWAHIKYIKDFYYSRRTNGTFAYAIRKEMFKPILAISDALEHPIDWYLILLQEKFKRKCFTFWPNICIADVSSSDIREKDRNVLRHNEKMRWNNGVKYE